MIEYVEPTLFEETNDHDNNTLKVPGQAKRPCGQFLWGCVCVCVYSYSEGLTEVYPLQPLGYVRLKYKMRRIYIRLLSK